MREFQGITFSGLQALSNHIQPPEVRLLFCRIVENWLHGVWARKVLSHEPDLFGFNDFREDGWLYSNDFAEWCDRVGVELDFAVQMIAHDRKHIEEVADKLHGHDEQRNARFIIDLAG